MSKFWLEHQINGCIEVYSCEVAVGLSYEVELVTGEELGVMQFYEQAIILNTLDRHKDDVFLLKMNNLSVKHVRLGVLSFASRCHSTEVKVAGW